MIGRTTNRIHFLDYLRGFMIVVLVMDHSMHGYSTLFKKSWYFQDFGGERLFDILHMHNDVIMMPFLFFLAGMFVLPSLERRGLKSFITEKFYRLFLPFVIGVPVLVPIQLYLSDLSKEITYDGYFDFVFNHFFWDRLWSSALWFLLSLMILTAILVLIQKLMPKVIDLLGVLAKWLVENPVRGVIAASLFAMISIGYSEIVFGRFDFNMATVLGTFGKLFKIRQSRFIMEISFFFLGAGFAKAAITTNQSTLSKIGQSWVKWALFALISGAAYITYSISNFYSGAYSLEILRHFYFGNGWDTVWPLMEMYAGPILVRTSLMGLFMIALTGFYVAVFQRFLDKPHPKWQNLAACSFGIYLFHEPIVVALNYAFFGDDISNYIKFGVTASLSLIGSWAITYALKPLPGFRKSL